MLLTQKLWLTGEQPGHWQDEFKGFCTQIYSPILRKITLCVCPQRVSNGFGLVDMFKFSSQLLRSQYPEITTIFQRRQPRKKLYGTKTSNVTSLGLLYTDLTKALRRMPYNLEIIKWQQHRLLNGEEVQPHSFLKLFSNKNFSETLTFSIKCYLLFI